MAFESLSERLQETLKKVKGQKTLTIENMDVMLREIRLALLEADVNFTVVKGFIERVKEKAIGQDVLKSLTPGQMVVKIVHDELVTLLGTTVSELEFTKKPTIVMMVGLQGAGKTTTAGKIAKLIKDKYSKNPLLVACDIYRPAAIDQLKTIGNQLNIPVFAKGTNFKAEEIAKEAIDFAKENHHDVVFIDTAGRLHIDNDLMKELQNIKEIVNPSEILLVVDSLTGQDIINVATTFNELLTITGAVLTKMDGDARGGGALSIREMTNVPIKFVGTGEKLDQIDLFYPERMADRILGMGDVMSLIEKAQDVMDEDKAMKSIDRLKKGTFGLDDMLDQLHQVRKMGPISGLLKMIPGMAGNIPNVNDEDTNKQFKKTEAIIYSMTPEERRNPDILRANRKQRIAKGAGVDVSEINRLLKQFEQSKLMMKQMGGFGIGVNSKKDVIQANRKKVRHKKKKR